MSDAMVEDRVAAFLVALVVIFFVLSIVRMGPQG